MGKVILNICFLLVGLSSCIVYNQTKERENICKLHAVKMHKSIVRAKYGLHCNSGVRATYINAKKVCCMGCVIRSHPRKRLAIIYHCSECLKLRRKSANF
jgi:hypothetical protein